MKDIFVRLLVGVGLPLCLGAAEFQPFEMEEFEEARNKENAFTQDDIPKTIPVPPVAERAATPDGPTKFPVRDLVVEGVNDYPGLGISAEEIQSLVDKKFREEQGIELDDNGFTRRDMEEIGSFLRNLVDRGGEDEEDLQNLMGLIEAQEFRRGWITVEQLDVIAGAITDHYRERGFILATAFVPQQQADDGVIRLRVLEGTLGAVTVSNNEKFTPEVIGTAVQAEVGKPVTDTAIESALRRTNDMPGLRVRGSFSPGRRVGETQLNLNVLEEQDWTASALVDNHGAKSTGKTRLFATTEWRNVASRGHRLLAGVLRTEGPDASTYGLLEYELPVTQDGRGRVQGTVSRNEFSVLAQLAGPTEIVGVTDNIGVEASYQLLRSRELNASVQAGYVHKDVLFDVAGVDVLSTDQQIDVVTLSGEYSRLWDEQQLLLSARLGVQEGHILKGSNRTLNQSNNFTKTLFNVNLLKRFNMTLPFIGHEAAYNFVVRSNGQYAEKFLPSVEQFALGGPAAVRAFRISDASVDSGFYTGFELFFDLPYDLPGRLNLPLDPLRPYAFFDYGYGVAHTNNGNIDTQLKGYGMGLRLNWPGQGTANLILAKPHSARYDLNAGGPQGSSRIYLDVLYQIQ